MSTENTVTTSRTTTFIELTGAKMKIVQLERLEELLRLEKAVLSSPVTVFVNRPTEEENLVELLQLNNILGANGFSEIKIFDDLPFHLNLSKIKQDLLQEELNDTLPTEVSLYSVDTLIKRK